VSVTVAQVKQRLYDLEILISGIGSAHIRAPRSLAEVNLPAFVNRVYDATYENTTFGEQITLIRRLYRLELYVTSYTLGLEGESEEKCEPFVDSVNQFFLDRRGLELTGSDTIVYDAILVSDTGVSMGIPYPGEVGILYSGILFDLRVSTLHQRDYKR
jgi:hypothetical protein